MLLLLTDSMPHPELMPYFCVSMAFYASFCFSLTHWIVVFYILPYLSSAPLASDPWLIEIDLPWYLFNNTCNCFKPYRVSGSLVLHQMDSAAYPCLVNDQVPHDFVSALTVCYYLYIRVL